MRNKMRHKLFIRYKIDISCAFRFCFLCENQSNTLKDLTDGVHYVVSVVVSLQVSSTCNWVT